MARLGVISAQAANLNVDADIGSVPLEFQDADGEVVGFEVDLVNEVAKRLGKSVEFVNTPFNGLFSGVQSGRINIAISSIIITDKRLESVTFAQPYYDSDQSLTATAASGITGLKDMGGKTIGVDNGSTGDMWVASSKDSLKFGKIRRFEGLSPAMLDLVACRIDGYVSDIPALLYYVKDKPDLKVVERIPTGERYSMMFNKGDPLAKEVNDVLTTLKGEGFIAKLHETWFGAKGREHDFHRRCARHACRQVTSSSGEAECLAGTQEPRWLESDKHVLQCRGVTRQLAATLVGLVVTLQIGITSILCGLAGGLFLAVARLYSPPFCQFLIRIYVDIFRLIPLLVLLIIVYYALPFLGIRLSPFLSAVTALSLVLAAYKAEIFRAGIEAIPNGQVEASAALGLSNRRTMVDVILPRAVRIVIPPLTNNCINVLKDTALASVVAMPDLLKQATQAQALSAVGSHRRQQHGAHILHAAGAKACAKP